MKRWAYLLLFAGLLSTARADDSDRLKQDGAWWQSLKIEYRLFWTIGYMSGHQDSDHQLRDLARGAGLSNNSLDVLQPMLKLDNATYEQVIAGMTKCYADFRNMQLTPGVCMVWVSMGINGSTDEQREKFLEGFRRQSK
jgi:hypothetical protein